MFEALSARARRLSEKRAQQTVRRIAAAAAQEAPPGVRVEGVAEGVTLSGKGLGRRMLQEPALRWLIERVK